MELETKITLKFGDQTVEMTLDEARELYTKLSTIVIQPINYSISSRAYGSFTGSPFSTRISGTVLT